MIWMTKNAAQWRGSLNSRFLENIFLGLKRNQACPLAGPLYSPKGNGFDTRVWSPRKILHEHEFVKL